MFRRILQFLAAAAFASAAAAGPPYVTDDPEPTEPGHWEVYLFAGADGAHGAWDGAAGADLNYGAAEDLQLTATVPIALSHESGAGTRAGAGDLEIGVKYRFLHAEAAGIDVAIFPRVILPTAGRRFGTGRAALLLPVWAEKDIGVWSLFGGAGYMVNPGAGNRNFWQSGLAVTRTVSPRLSIGGEATLEGPDQADGHRTAGVDLGGIYKLGGPFALLFSGGPVKEHHGPTGWRGYAALGLSF
ncbi:MAG: hypothetical protein E6G94_08865 [Alphaproteobacteria bacterium]|nr:MAG: hypothetical protein E6G94_08865 [Alphaproteobacteria bacterium]